MSEPRQPGRYGPQSEEEWGVAEQIVEKASAMYDDVGAQLKDSQDAVQDAGRLAGQLVYTIEKDIESKGKQVSDAQAEGAFKLLVEDFVEMAHGIGVLPAEAQEDIDAALKAAAQAAGETYYQMSTQGGGQGEQPQMPMQPEMPERGIL
jgi:hypothetical protein